MRGSDAVRSAGGAQLVRQTFDVAERCGPVDRAVRGARPTRVHADLELLPLVRAVPRSEPVLPRKIGLSCALGHENRTRRKVEHARPTVRPAARLTLADPVSARIEAAVKCGLSLETITLHEFPLLDR